jgi:hypothetical protein
MEEFLRSPEAADTLGLIGVFICVAITVVGCTVAVQWRKARQAALDADLKHDMLQQGMSADEIVRVLEASGAARALEVAYREMP